MSVTITNTGSGKFIPSGNQSDVIISYDISEGASPISMNSLAGEIPSMSVTALSNSVQSLNNTHPSSKLLIDNQMTLTDSIRGSFSGRVNSLDINSNSVSVDIMSPFEKLNITKRMNPQNGTLKSCFENYFNDAGVTSYSVDSSLTENIVVPGWTDVIWNGLKMLCVASSTEMYIQNGIVYVKPRAQKTFNLKNISNENYSISLGDQAKTTKFTKNKTTWVSNAIVFAYDKSENVESVDANEVKDIILTSKISLSSINQPAYVTTMFNSYANYIQSSSIGTVPSEYANGFYTFRNSIGGIVPSSVVIASGASVSASLTDNSYEIKLTITGPNVKYNTPWTLEFSDNIPSLGLTGTGVMVDSQTISFGTGSAIGDTENEYTNNPFLLNEKYLYNTAYYTNQDICGPIVNFSFATDKIVEANNQEFGYLPGAIFSYNESKYRVESVSYTHDSIDVSSRQYVTFNDFNSKWSGKTIAQFNSTMLDPATYPNDYMKYSDFAIIPLMEPTA